MVIKLNQVDSDLHYENDLAADQRTAPSGSPAFGIFSRIQGKRFQKSDRVVMPFLSLKKSSS